MDGLSYQWYEEVQHDDGYVYREKIDGATENTYTVYNVTRRMNFTCTVTDIYGNTADERMTATVDNNLEAEAKDHMTGVSVEYGKDAQLQVTVSADNMEGITYRWYSHRLDQNTGYWERDEIAGAESDTYTVENVTSKGTYICAVEDMYGNESEVWFDVSVLNHLTVRAANGEALVAVPYGEDAQLQVTVTADNMDGMEYQWSKRVYNEEYQYWESREIEGAVYDSYTVENVTGLEEYVCDVTDGFGTTAGTSFTVTVDNNLRAEPKDGKDTVYTPYGESAELAVTVSADNTEGLKYRWYAYVKNEEYGYYDFEEIEGAASAVYNTQGITERTHFECRVEDVYGNIQYVNFDAAVENNLTVRPADGLYEVYVSKGDSVTVSVVASADDSEGLTYQWFRRVYIPEYDESYIMPIENADSDTYTLDEVTESGEYECYVNDKYGNYESAAITVNLIGDLAIINGPDDCSVTEGEPAQFSVKATGAAAYQWQYSKNGGRTWANVGTTMTSARTDTLTFTAKKSYAGYYYQCVVTGEDGTTVTSEPAKLTVFSAFDIVSASEDVTAAAGESVIFSVEATGAVSYQWRFSKNGGRTWTDVGATIPSARTETLTFKAKESYDGYQYQSVVTSVKGETLSSFPAKLIIAKSFAVTRQPENVTATEGESVTFAVKAVGAVSYQWQYSKNGVKWTNVGTTIKSAKTDTLSFTARGSYNGYQYRCAVTGEDGSTLISEPALLSVG